MTRINLIPPEELITPHLIAEYTELPRVFRLVRYHVQQDHRPEDLSIPKTYTMGRGHVTFFYDKLEFVNTRQMKIISEMLRRRYNPRWRSPPKESFLDIPDCWWNDWIPSEDEIAISRARIDERRKEMGI